MTSGPLTRARPPRPHLWGWPDLTKSRLADQAAVALLTGGADRPYVFGLATALMSKGAYLDLVGSSELDCSQFHGQPGINFLNLRGDQRSDVGAARKAFRVLKYYMRLIRYAATATPRIFHILWNNKFESFDRTVLMLYYRLLGKRISLTVHNVNAGRRDSRDKPLNRYTLWIQYHLAHHLFVHTERMKVELRDEFGLEEDRITVIPFGINNAVPNTRITPSEAKQRLGLSSGERTILFFGHIAPYKGLEYLVAAFQTLLARRGDYRLIVAGKPKNCPGYWKAVLDSMGEEVRTGRVLVKAEHIPDEDTEVYFKAADVLVLPYRHIYQSGVLFLGQSFGLPVLAADVGSLKDDIVEGKTGFIFKPEDPTDLARTIELYFAGDLFRDLGSHRQEIQRYAMKRHSWDAIAETTLGVYRGLHPQAASPKIVPKREASNPSLDAKVSS